MVRAIRCMSEECATGYLFCDSCSTGQGLSCIGLQGVELRIH